MVRTLAALFLLIFIGCATQQVGLLQNQSLLQQIKSKHTFYSTSIDNQYLASLLEKLTSKESHLKPKVSIVNSDSAIALASTTGEILLSTALVKSFASESQLAFILAHEIAHIELKHTQVTASDPVSAFAVSRDQELEADRLGLEKIITAGFDPRQAILALAQIYRLKGIDVKSKSHPEFSKRTFELQKIMMVRPAWTQHSNTAEREFRKFVGSLP